MSMSIRRRRVSRAVVALLALLAAVAAVAATAGPAQAGTNASSAVGPINSTWIDLGLGPTLSNQPAGAALMYWNRSGNTVSPRLIGNLSMINSAGTCGSVRMRYYLGLTQVAVEYSLPLCTGTNALIQQLVYTGTQSNILISGVYVEVGLDPWATPGSWQPIHTVYVPA
jgi:hypothetical protein